MASTWDMPRATHRLSHLSQLPTSDQGSILLNFKNDFVCVSDKRHYEAQAILELGFLLPQPPEYRQLNHVPPYLAQHLQPNRSVHAGQDKHIRVVLMYTHTHIFLEQAWPVDRNTDFFPTQPTPHVPALQVLCFPTAGLHSTPHKTTCF